MNHRITLRKRGPGTDGWAQPLPDEGWTDVASVWADVQFQTGREVLRAGAEITVKRASVRIRARQDVDAGWGIRYRGEDYDIKGPPLPDRDPEFMFLVCEAAR